MSKPEKQKTEMTPNSRVEAYYTVKSLVGVLVALVFVFTFVGRLIVVDGESMEPTLWHGEMLLVRSGGYEPENGDIVILAKDGFHDGDAIVKRVIATEHQEVLIDYASGTVYVNGDPLNEPYIKEYMVQFPYQTISSITVPEGCIFVMGDNRNNSDDSRNPDLGVVDTRLILGKAVLVIFPFSNIHKL